MRRLLLLAPLLAFAIAGGCKKSDPPTVLQPEDLTPPDGLTFDPNEILDPGSFTDTQTLAAIDIQNFLERGPYKRASFLSTYPSNGVRAVDAIIGTAVKYGINPLVFLVRAEVDQGLIGAQYYPFPTSRVEYVFGCGCGAGGGAPCDPALAGFDKQVDCLGRKLSTSLAEIAANGSTAGGWAPGQPSTTVDGQSVTPADSSTAALYQYDPRVGTNSNGNWLFWNIWQEYALFLSYAGPIGNPQTKGGWIGDPCANDGACTVPGGFCATNFPGGMCTVACTDQCPLGTDRPASFCADFGSQGGYCLALCNPSTPGSCRDGYACQSIAELGADGGSQNGCAQAM